jgi:hypothetical protein
MGADDLSMRDLSAPRARQRPRRSQTHSTAIEIALRQFQQYLRHKRSLSEARVINYTPVVRSFLSERFPKGAVHCHKITAVDITAFVQRRPSWSSPDARPWW